MVGTESQALGMLGKLFIHQAMSSAVLSKYWVHMMEGGHSLVMKHLMRSAFFTVFLKFLKLKTRGPKKKAEAEVKVDLRNLVQIFVCIDNIIYF